MANDIPLDKLRVGIIGLGNWGQCHLQIFHQLPHVEVKAICELNSDVLTRTSNQYGIEGKYTDYKEMLQRDDLDLISVVTYEKDHLAPTILALETGRDVIVEKPITTSFKETKLMLEATYRSGRHVYPGHLLRFEPRYAHLQKVIQNGELGEVMSLHMKRSRPSSLLETFSRVHTAFELTVNDIDIALWFMGCKVKQVQAYDCHSEVSGNPQMLWSMLEFENGALAVLQSSWVIPDHVAIEIDDVVEFTGTKGSARFATRPAGLELWNERGISVADYGFHTMLPSGFLVGALNSQLSYITSCLLRGEIPVGLSFEDAVHGIQIAEAIVQSHKTGSKIVL